MQIWKDRSSHSNQNKFTTESEQKCANFTAFIYCRCARSTILFHSFIDYKWDEFKSGTPSNSRCFATIHKLTHSQKMTKPNVTRTVQQCILYTVNMKTKHILRWRKSKNIQNSQKKKNKMSQLVARLWYWVFMLILKRKCCCLWRMKMNEWKKNTNIG